MTAFDDMVTGVGVLRPEDKLIIHLREDITVEHLGQISSEVNNILPGNQIVVFNGNIVEKLVIVQPPVDADSIVDGSRQILEDMKSVTG